uniref:Uncharacterized protein n=1 Tax=Mycena chlorophos TaxID=658473 RepID=A0ABQ0LDB0_MYCCL|nr:predicted protein [Mycena chlorophos]
MPGQRTMHSSTTNDGQGWICRYLSVLLCHTLSSLLATTIPSSRDFFLPSTDAHRCPSPKYSCKNGFPSPAGPIGVRSIANLPQTHRCSTTKSAAASAIPGVSTALPTSSPSPRSILTFETSRIAARSTSAHSAARFCPAMLGVPTWNPPICPPPSSPSTQTHPDDQYRAFPAECLPKWASAYNPGGRICPNATHFIASSIPSTPFAHHSEQSLVFVTNTALYRQFNLAPFPEPRSRKLRIVCAGRLPLRTETLGCKSKCPLRRTKVSNKARRCSSTRDCGWTGTRQESIIAAGTYVGRSKHRVGDLAEAAAAVSVGAGNDDGW